MKRKNEEQNSDKLIKKQKKIIPIQNPNFNNGLNWFIVVSENIEAYFNSFEDAKYFALMKKSEGIKYMKLCKLEFLCDTYIDTPLIKNYITYKTIEEIQ
jgi:hypothetical protein